MNANTGCHTYALVISFSVLITLGLGRAGYGQSSADATLSALTVSPVDIAGFASDVTEYHVGVADSVTQVTITPRASDSGATIQIGKSLSQSNTVSSGSGHVVSLDEGLNRVYVWVTSSGGNTRKGYTLIVGRGVDDGFGWKAADDFNTLRAAGNRSANGIWSDGTTMWVADEQDAKLYAYDMRTKARDAVRDFNTLAAAGNESPEGIWSDGTTMWVADWSDRKLYAYNMSTKARDTSKEVDRQTAGGGNLHPKGIWSDGTTMWVAYSFGTSGHGVLLAHTLGTNSRDAEKDFNTLQAAGNEHPGGIWSDGATMWVSDDRKLYAYNLHTKERNAALDYNTLKDAHANFVPTGIWSDGAIMWVADANGKIFSFNRPPPVSYDSDSDGLIEIGTLAQLNAIRWDRDGDGIVDNVANASAYAAAFPFPAAGMGCPATCIGYELVASLSFDENDDGRITAADGGYWNGGAGWLPIGSLAATFEGNGHTIANLYVNRSGRTSIGLFGEISAGGQVRNVGVRDLSITSSGRAYVGGLAGRNLSGNIVSCHATGAITSSGRANVGGLLGDNSSGNIVASYATGAITSSGRTNVGGLLGDNFSGDIIACYATGTVTGSGNYTSVGGLLGDNFSGDIVVSYATGAVTGSNGDYVEVGGLVGDNFSGNIVACYATGTVSGSSGNYASVGGLAGDNFTGGIVACYWNTATSGQRTSAGGIGKSTAQLQSPTGYTGIYANWNLDLDNADGDGTLSTGGDDPWDFGTSGQYPALNLASLRALAQIRFITLVCDRTRQVRDAILGEVRGVSACVEVTSAHLATIRQLNVERKSVSSLKSGDFAGLTSLFTLQLGENEIASLPDDVFNGLSSLNGLWMDNNDLTDLPAGIFDNLSSLTELDMRGNQFTSLPVGIFDDLTSLTGLGLGSNQLTSIPAGIFDNLSSLTSLRLHNNKIGALSDRVFSGLSSLTRLWLQGNAVDPLPLTVSLEKVGDGQFTAVAATGAPFTIVLPLTVTGGSISGGATSITIPVGSVASDTLTTTRTSGTANAVTVDIGALPGLPSEVDQQGHRRHQGYRLVKSAVLPLEVISVTIGGQASTDFNGDGKTDFVDFFLFADAYGSTNANFDLDGNGTVDFADFFRFVDAFGS